MNAETHIIGESTAIAELRNLAWQVAKTEVTVLITGETGSGKEVLASYLHEHSKRAHSKFIAVNCGAIPSGILESELFGHEKGAFTGALQARKGYFETAHQGTIFLDEIGEMPLATQVKLLRVIETGEFQRVGASEVISADTRIIAATNRSLQHEVAEKNFREDLFYRLQSVELRIPPLRERGHDILLLTEYFIHKAEKKHGISFSGFTREASGMLLDYGWPGNVRELKNLVESLLILEKGHEITPDILERHLVQRSRFKSLVHDPEQSEKNQLNLIYSSLIQLHQEIYEIRQLLQEQDQRPAPPRTTPLLLPPATVPEHKPHAESTQTSLTLEEMEKQHILLTLETCGGNKRQAAKALGITERTLYRKLNAYQEAGN
ncbi:sigma-54 interaction domain-containing protein [Prosthecochloris vibrioformis]|uniref:Sigma-54-dependent Fis family transcriptional regulator n=1 Tax=Prosthecochloris vibrioformis TaxID=1098 RepID=A0A5C4S1C6_PROVB|nr:sigma-54 dependent transcriptional regulator [Prosthecochloris vibrioformis]TNJ37264.1 sigma-54-dependent Fis family transcriptional regulator [Prosthecochloris vibrioformis]